MSSLVIAIDGPSGPGKSSTAKAIAKRANWSYLDTGALYRAVTFLSLQNQKLKEQEVLDLLKTNIISFNTNPSTPATFLNGKIS